MAIWDGFEIGRVRYRLRLAGEVRFHFRHEGVLRGVLSRSLGRHELPAGVMAAAPESGRLERALLLGRLRFAWRVVTARRRLPTANPINEGGRVSYGMSSRIRRRSVPTRVERPG